MTAKKSLKTLSFILINILFITSCAQLSPKEKEKKENVSKPQKVSAEELSSKLLLSPRPNRLDLNRMRSNGRKILVDMRSPEELTGEVRSLASEYGMTYYNIPFFNSEGEINSQAIEKVGTLVAQDSERSVVHCSSGNRASAWFSLYLHQEYDWDIEKAINEGQKHRLTKEKLMNQIRESVH